MEQEHTKTVGSNQPDDLSSKGSGPQGTDKAPGEETSTSTDDLVRISQKGKIVDADPSGPSGQPVPER